jgi:hypothetical protein
MKGGRATGELRTIVANDRSDGCAACYGYQRSSYVIRRPSLSPTIGTREPVPGAKKIVAVLRGVLFLASSF